MMTRQTLLGPADVATYLGVTEKTLAQWRWLRRGPRWVKVGGRIRYRWADVEKWLDEQARGGDAA